MKNNKFCCNINQIDICGQIVSILHHNGIEFVWQLIVANDQYLTQTVGPCNARLIRNGLSSFLKDDSLEDLINFVDSFLENKISDFPELYSLADYHIREKKLLYLFDDKLSEAKKLLINIIHQEIFKLKTKPSAP